MLQDNVCSTNCRLFINEQIDLNIAITHTLNWQPLTGANAVDKSLIATIISELASNIIKYANPGYIELRSYEWPGTVEIEVLATDTGPGIDNVEQAMQENFSSSGTLGLGLSGVKRIADAFDIHSNLGHGTCVFARKNIKVDTKIQVLSSTKAFYSSTSERLVEFRNANSIKASPLINFEIGNRTRAYPGYRVSGDQVLAIPLEQGYLLSIVDATGHGPEANKMALLLLNGLKKIASSNLSNLMIKLDQLAKGTIGAAMGLAFFDPTKQMVTYAGIGNTNLIVFNDKKWQGVSRDGILGQRLPSYTEQSTHFNPGDMAIMFTDGLSESLIKKEALKLRFLDANTIAYRLVDLLGKTHDDASCIVIKWNK
jgi:anti-sigma regulatory factor (Ser/Thr protein kinase)